MVPAGAARRLASTSGATQIMDSEVASRRMMYISPDGERTAVTLRVGTPRAHPDGGWGCPVEIESWFVDLRDIRGVDSWQALTAGIAFLSRLLQGALVKRGGTLRYLDDEDAIVDLTKLFVGGA